MMKPISHNSFKQIDEAIAGAFYYKNDVRITSSLYLFFDNKKTLLVDSGDGQDRFTFAPDACFLTHGHFDHSHGVKPDWKNVYLHPSEQGALRYMHIPANAKAPPSASFDFGKFHFELLHTPGHTPGSVCLYETHNAILVSGDTLFANGGQGRTDLGGDDAELRMQESLDILSRLGWKILCPGHGEPEIRE